MIDSLMIVSEPFAVAYGLDALLHTMIIDIGAGTIDFCVMKGRYPTDNDQRSLTAAGDSIDTRLMKLIQARYPTASFTVFMVREWKEKYSFVGDAPEPVIVTVPVNGVPTRIDVTDEMRAATNRSSRRSSKPCSIYCCGRTEAQEHVRKNVILAGGGGLFAISVRPRAGTGTGQRRQVRHQGPVFVGSDGGWRSRRLLRTATGIGC
jgi:rod shape-determining protein MreB